MAAPVQAVPVQAYPPVYLDLHISCKDLRKADIASKSDPIGVVYMRRSLQEEWVEVGRTEWIKNNQNPSFVRPVRIQYTFEVTQFLRFAIYDVDDEKAKKLSKTDHLGATETTLAAVLAYPGGTWTQRLEYLANTKVNAGSISVVAQEVRDSNYEVNFGLGGRGLDKKDVIGKSDPYIIIRKKLGADFVPVHQTEVIKNTLNPDWRSFTINMQQLCGCDMQCPISFDCYDWDKHSQHDLIGSCETNMERLLHWASQGPLDLPLVNPKKLGKRGYIDSGKLYFNQFNITPIPSFIDYIHGGLELNMVVAIDFTASNGFPSNKHSLHHVDPQCPNQYELAIQSVGSILSCYDRDGMIAAYGYGGSVGGKVSHCFPLNGNPANPEVPGIQGLLDAYHLALDNVDLSGPTYFAEVIHQTANIIRAMSNPAQQKYFVLLIITDGCINDMDKTVSEIIDCANNLPLSIVIVGVGYNSELKKMETLDGDEEALKDKNGKKAKRDIVQYVPFAKYVDCPARLAQETLAEIPKQLVDYMRSHGIAPLIPPPAVPMASLCAPPTAVAGAPPPM